MKLALPWIPCAVLVVAIAISIAFFKQDHHSSPFISPSTSVIMPDLLPTDVVPSRYDITLAPDFTTFKAKGYEEIHVKVAKETSKVLVHSKEITVDTTEYISSSGEHYTTKYSLFTA